MKLFPILSSFLIYFSLGVQTSYANLKVGTVIFYPPFSMSAGTGFDATLMHTICSRLREKCVSIPMDYYQLFPALEAGKIDIATAGITIPIDPSGNYIYSLPYLVSKGTFLVLKNNNAKSTKDLRGRNVGIMREGIREGAFYEYLFINYPKQFQIMTFNEMEDLIDALKKGRISAAFTHESTSIYWKLIGDGQFKSLGKSVIVGDGIGIMATPKKSALIKKINREILKIEKEKFYLDLYNTYFITEH